MSVFVGPVVACAPDERFEWPERARLYADAEHELRDFADELGLRPVWFRKDGPDALPHYDVTAGMRKRAIMMGAKDVGSDEVARFESAWKAGKAMEKRTGLLFGDEGRML